MDLLVPFSQHGCRNITHSRVLHWQLVLLLKYAFLLEGDACAVPSEADFASHLTRLLNIMFEVGEVPADWNTILVSPMFKRGDRCDTANYRPIALG